MILSCDPAPGQIPMTGWVQDYDPFHNAWLSTAVAATPVILLFYLLAVKRILAHRLLVFFFAYYGQGWIPHGRIW